MIFRPEWFDATTLLAAWLVLLLLLAASARSALNVFRQYSSACLLAVVILVCAWCLSASPDDGQLAGISYHLLAVNLVALMVGIPAALWLSALLLLPYLALFGAGWAVYPANALALLLPALLVNALSRYLVSRLPANIFIFIFVNGFLAAAAGMMLTGLVLVSVLDWRDAFGSVVLWQTAFPVFILVSWAEAFLSGITTAIFIALRPKWIHTFDDNRYLQSSNRIW